VAREFRKFFLVYDLAKLLLLTGLTNQFDRDKAADSALAIAWTCICTVAWSEEYRYLPRGSWTAQETRAFIDAINQFKAWLSTT